MLLGYIVASVCQPKKFDWVHQTVSPCERVGCGDETNIIWNIQSSSMGAHDKQFIVVISCVDIYR